MFLAGLAFGFIIGGSIGAIVMAIFCGGTESDK